MKNKFKKSYCIFIFLMLTVSILLLPFCFRKEETFFSVTGPGMRERTTPLPDAGVTYYFSPEFTLPAGVYHVCTDCVSLPENTMLRLSFTGSEDPYKALRVNDVLFYGGQTPTDYEMYVSHTVERVQLSCVIWNTDYDVLGGIRLVRTPIGGRLLLGLVWFFGILLGGLWILRGHILSGKLSPARQRTIGMLAVCVLIVYIPCLNDYLIPGSETASYLQLIENPGDALQTGHLFLLLPILLRRFGFPLGFVFKLLTLLTLILQTLICFRCFFCCTENENASRLGTLFPLLSPFLFRNVYQYGAINKQIGMVMLPLILTGIFLLYTKEHTDGHYPRYKFYLILGLTGILQCHPILFAPVVLGMVLFCLVRIRKTLQKSTLLQLLQAGIFTIVLNGILWLPLLCTGGWRALSLPIPNRQTISMLGLPLLIIPAGMLLSFFILWLQKHFRPAVQRIFIPCLILALVIPALYQAGNIAYDSRPVRIYASPNLATIRIVNGEEPPFED